jgi:hypothetical protein
MLKIKDADGRTKFVLDDDDEEPRLVDEHGDPIEEVEEEKPEEEKN